MFKKILLLILISSSIFIANTNDEKFLLDEFDDLEFCDDEFNMDDCNLVECMHCGQFAAFIFLMDGDLSGICAKCFLE